MRGITKIFVLALILSIPVVPASAAEPASEEAVNMANAIQNSIVTVMPEIATPVEMSSSDVNRIACQEEIKDIIFSKEKGVTARITGRDAFIKFLIAKQGRKEVFSTTPTEIYVVCGDTIYTIIAIPKRIPSQTVRLRSDTQKIRKNVSLYGGMPLEKKVISIIKSVYTEDIPEGFTVKFMAGQKNNSLDLFKDMTLMLYKLVRIDGEGLQAKEYRAEAKADAKGVELKESDFLRTEITEKPVAIMVDKLNLHKGETARIIVVEHSGGQIEK